MAKSAASLCFLPPVICDVSQYGEGMSNAIIALLLFIAALGGLALLYGKFGNLSLWKLAAKFHELPLEHVSNDPAWVVLHGSESVPGEGFTGPFLLAVPSLGHTLKLYARKNQIEVSQQRFIEAYQKSYCRDTVFRI